MDTRQKLAAGIQAAKNGDRSTAQQLLYDVIDDEPRNEAAWVWLSYLAETIEDRKICLENVLVINPNNDYALRGMAQLAEYSRPKAAKQARIVRPISPGVRPLAFITAFWTGVGVLFAVVGIKDVFARIGELIISRNFPYYITPLQLWTLGIAVSFLILGIIALNLAWGLYSKSKIAYFVSILLALGLTLLAPTALLISEAFNYFYVVISGIIPVSVLFLTIMSQPGFDHDRTASTATEQN